jgi:non-ribosomal peptide synthetase component F
VERSFTSVLKATREVFLQALVHQDVPYYQVVEELRPERSLGHSPLFQIMFTMQNAPYARRIELPSVEMEVEIPDSGAAKFDLAISIQEEADGLQGQIEYRADLFDENTVRRLAEHYVLLLREVVAHPERRLSELDLLDEVERHQLLLEWNDTGGGLESVPTVQSVFEAQAARTPEAWAVRAQEGGLTYADLSGDRISSRVISNVSASGRRYGWGSVPSALWT